MGDGSQPPDTPTTTSRHHGCKKWPTIPQMMDLVSSPFSSDRAVLVPMPTADPRDPLNLPGRRKVAAVLAVCCLGALSSAAELILGTMLPVFVFLYAGLDPALLARGLPASPPNPLARLAALSSASSGPPLWHVYLLGSAPLLVAGAANLALVPLALAVGRRPVLLATAAAALAGALAAGLSRSLAAHLAARCVQALGSAAVHALLPLTLHDLAFRHQRGAAVAAVFAAQGLAVAVLGVAAPYVVLYAGWRVLYFAAACAGLVLWVAVFLLLPETRFARSAREHRGLPGAPLPPRRNRPEVVGRRRRWAEDLALVTGRPGWREGAAAVRDSLRTLLHPHLLFVGLLNAAVMGMAVAAGYTAVPRLLAEPWAWPFRNIGLCLFPVILASGASFVVSGWGAELVAHWVAGRKGTRTPELQLLNLVFPCVVGLAGCVLFGVSGENPERYHWIMFLMGLVCITFSLFATNTISIAYVLESNPQLAGPSLVNMASFRCLVAFALVVRVSEWVADLGYLKTFIIYACILGSFTLFIPIVYVWGGRWRERLQ